MDTARPLSVSQGEKPGGLFCVFRAIGWTVQKPVQETHPPENQLYSAFHDITPSQEAEQ
jgi:hypothetical protein